MTFVYLEGSPSGIYSMGEEYYWLEDYDAEEERKHRYRYLDIGIGIGTLIQVPEFAIQIFGGDFPLNGIDVENDINAPISGFYASAAYRLGFFGRTTTQRGTNMEPGELRPRKDFGPARKRILVILGGLAVVIVLAQIL